MLESVGGHAPHFGKGVKWRQYAAATRRPSLQIAQTIRPATAKRAPSPKRDTACHVGNVADSDDLAIHRY